MLDRAKGEHHAPSAAPRQSTGHELGNAARQPDSSGSAYSAQDPRRALQMQRAFGNQATLQMLRGNGSGVSSPSFPAPHLPIQAKAARLNSIFGAHMRDYTEQTTSAGQKAYQVKEDAQKGGKIGRGDEFEDLEIDDTTGKWRMIQVGQDKGFIRKDKVGYKSSAGLRDSLSAAKRQQNVPMAQIGTPVRDDDEEGAMENMAEGGELLMTAPEGVMDVNDELIDALEDVAGKEDEKDALEHQQAVLGVSTSPLALGNSALEGLIGMKKMIKSYKDPDKETDEKAFDMVEGAIDTASGTTGFIEGVSGVVKDAGSLKGKELSKAEAVSDWSGSVGDAIGAIKNVFFAVKDIYDLVQKAFSKEGADMDEAFTGGMSVIQNLLEAAKGGVETAKSILKILKMGTGELSKVIPGLGIAISGITITVKVYNMIKSTISQFDMTAVKRKFKEKYKGGAGDYVKENTYKLGSYTLHSSTGTDAEKLEARVTALKGKQNRTDDEEQELRDIEEYRLAKEMKSINNKRLVRGTIQIGLEMTNIAGDIATLSGVGAQAGIPLKAAASGAGTAMSVARKIKQYGRDRAAKADAWSITKTVFNANKSSDKKQEKRIEHANMILDMIAELPEYSASDRQVQQQYVRVEKFIASTGANLRELYRLNGDVGKQRQLLVQSMAQRE